MGISIYSPFPRMRESVSMITWVPAFAGTTKFEFMEVPLWRT